MLYEVITFAQAKPGTGDLFAVGRPDAAPGRADRLLAAQALLGLVDLSYNFV